MSTGRVGRYVNRIRGGLHDAFAEDHPPEVSAGSFTLGVLLLGPLEGVSMADVSFAAGPEIVVRLLVGNLILAAVAAIGSYVVVHRLAVRYAASDVAATVDEALDEVADAVLEP